MDKQRFVRKLVAAAVLTAFGVGSALAVDEFEPNQPISSSQRLTFTSGASALTSSTASNTGSASVNGAIAAGSTDVDFYSFEGKMGDVVTIDTGCTPFEGVDTILTLFGPDNSYVVEDDDGALCDPSLGRGSMITYALPADGVYTAAVTAYSVTLTSGGIFGSMDQLSSGPYVLTVSGVSLPPVAEPPAPPPPPPVTPIAINIRPASTTRTPVNPKSNGTIPVVLLSSPDFKPLEVDVKSVTFGHSGDEASLRKCEAGGDFNRDGIADLVCHFDNQLAKFVPGDLVGNIKGKTKDGKDFAGKGGLKATLVKKGKR
jgi:hypothetical protein